ncbi:hypothetical protein ACWGVR_02135 [Streptomyces xanthophaeus]
MAAAGCYSDCVSEGACQVRHQEAEFVRVRLLVGKDFGYVAQELGTQP